jgi:predicted ABC-type ATPase
MTPVDRLAGVLRAKGYSRSLARSTARAVAETVWGKRFGPREPFSREQRAAIRDYAGRRASVAKELNRSLRAGRTSAKHNGVREQLDSAFGRVAPLSRESVVYRGTKVGGANGLRVGQVVQDKGFMSTVAWRPQADDFAVYSKGDVFAITLPPGTKALDINEAAGSAFEKEHEVLLPRGTKLEIESFEHHPELSHARLIHARVVLGAVKKYNPSQPRDPGGEHGGQWVSHGGGGGGGGDSQAKHMVDGVYTAKRAVLHRQILDHFLADAPVIPEGKRSVLFTAGGTASGKSTVIGGPTALVPAPTGAVHVDPDAIKALLPEYKAMVAAGDKTAAAYVHEESSDLAKALTVQARERGHNLFIDGTGDSGPGKFADKMTKLAASGYRVQVAYVTIPTAEALKRSAKRAKRTGRAVPPKDIKELHSSVSARYPEVEKLAEQGKLDALTVHDNRGTAPVQIMHLQDGRPVYDDPELMREFKDKGKP